MKKTVKLLIALLLLLAVPLTMLTVGVLLPDFYGDTYYAVIARMQERLEITEEPKIIVVGGSNVAFGLDGAQLEELLAQQAMTTPSAPSVCMPPWVPERHAGPEPEFPESGRYRGVGGGTHLRNHVLLFWRGGIPEMCGSRCVPDCLTQPGEAGRPCGQLHSLRAAALRHCGIR